MSVEPKFSDSESDSESELKKDSYYSLIDEYRNYSTKQLKQMIEIGKSVLVNTEITLNSPLTQKIDNLIGTYDNIQQDIKCITNNSSKKGTIGENIIYNHLRCILPTQCIKIVSKGNYQADIHIKFRERLIIIDTKFYAKPVPSEEIVKLKRDANTTKCSMAFLISLTSNISTIEDPVQMERIGDQIFVYISNTDIDQIIGIFMGLLNYNDLLRNVIENTESPSDMKKLVQQMNMTINTINRSISNYNIISNHILNLEKNIKDLSSDFIKCQETMACDINEMYKSIQTDCIFKDEFIEFEDKTDQEKIEFYFGSYIYTSITKTYRLLMIRIGNFLNDKGFDIKITQNDKFYEINVYKNDKLICKSETKNTKQYKCFIIFNDKKIQLLSTKIDDIFQEFQGHV